MKHMLPASKLITPPRLLPVSITAALAFSAPAVAEHHSSVNQQETSYRIAAGPIGSALNSLARQAGTSIFFNADDLKGIQTEGLQGRYSLSQAFNKLLQNTDLIHKKTKTGFIVTLKSKDSPELTPVVVMGRSDRFGDVIEPGGFKAVYQSTATKTPLALRDTPQAIAVVTSESMDARQVDDLQSALELKAGIAGSYFGYPGPFSGSAPLGGSNAFSIRGQRLDGQQDIRADGFALISETNHDTALYERIEVVKGPSGYYGQGSLGGFINMVRKKPQAEFKSSVSAQVGSYDTYKGEFDVTGALNEEENITGRLIAVTVDEGSFIDAVETQRQILAPSVEATVGDNTRILVNMLYQNEDFIPSMGMPLRAEGDKEVAYDFDHSFFYGDPTRQEPSNVETIGASIRVDHELNDKWLTTLVLQKESANRSDIGISYGYGSGDTHYFYSGWTDKELDNWAGEIRLDGRFEFLGQEHRLTTGIERNERSIEKRHGSAENGSVTTEDLYLVDFYNKLDVVPLSDMPLETHENYSSESTAFYLQGVIGLTEQTKLLAGARYDKVDQRRLNLMTDSLFTNTDHSWTSRVGLNHKFNQNVSAYVAYAESFTPVEKTSRSGDVLDPETGTGYEVGLKTEWFDGKLGANFAIYRQELDNQPISDPANSRTENYSISAGLQRTDGVELEVTGSPLQGLTVSAAAFYLDSEYIDKRDPNFGKSSWGSLDSQFSIYTAYKLQDGLMKGLEPSITFIKTGDTATATWFSEQREVEGYERVDLGFSYNEFPNLKLSLQIRNVLDEKYVEKIRGSGWYNYFGAPRTALFKATYDF